RREPTVIVLDPTVELATEETTGLALWHLGGRFTFERERLVKLVWHNSYDARGAEPIWWWSHKAAARTGMTIDGSADVVTASGTPTWIDGGPRQPFDLPTAVVHHETIELGRDTPVPGPVTPSEDL